jgi:surface protein
MRFTPQLSIAATATFWINYTLLFGLCLVNGITDGSLNSTASSTPRFTGSFHIVRAKVKNPPTLGSFTVSSTLVPSFGTDPLSLYVDYEGLFARVVFRYSTSASKQIQQLELRPPYALGGNIDNLFLPVPYLQANEKKVINVRGFNTRGKVVATMNLAFSTSIAPTLTPPSPAPTHVRKPVRPVTSPPSPTSSPSYKCFETRVELSDAVASYFSGQINLKNNVKKNYGSMNSWCVDYIQDFSFLFENQIVEEYIGDWNTSSATRMSFMFRSNSVFNQDISRWDVSRVRDMGAMFFQNTNFNQNLTLWDVSRVTNMGEMFFNSSFNGDISKWNVSSVTSMQQMFAFTESFNSDISSWNVSSVVNMRNIFYSAVSFNQDLSKWDVSRVEDMNGMFASTKLFNSDLSKWNVGKVRSMTLMFLDSSFNRDISGWNVTSVVDMEVMFFGSSLKQNLCRWGRKLPAKTYSSMTDMFKYTNCPSTLSPSSEQKPRGPFCHICTM